MSNNSEAITHERYTKDKITVREQDKEARLLHSYRNTDHVIINNPRRCSYQYVHTNVLKATAIKFYRTTLSYDIEMHLAGNRI